MQRVAVAVFAWGATIVAVATILIAQITKAPIAQRLLFFDVISGFATVDWASRMQGSCRTRAGVLAGDHLHGPRWCTVTLAAAVAATSRSRSAAVERPIVG